MAHYNKNKNKKKYKKYARTFQRGELTKQALLAIGAGIALSALFVAPGLAVASNHLNKLEKSKRIREQKRHRDRMRKLVENLKKNRLVEIYEKNGEEIVELAEGGKKRILKYRLDELQLTIPKRWDGKWRVISFDIPEKHKKAREALRFKLKLLGFFPLQKSVFITPYACKDEIDFITEIFEVGRYVNYFEAIAFDDPSKLHIAFPNVE